MEDCVFCKIVKGELPCYKVWEDENHLAFLSIAPPVEGMTVVIPKKHTQSYFAKANEEVTTGLVEASKKVAVILDEKLDNVSGTMLVFQGLEIDHLHVKLYPMYKSDGDIFESVPENASQEELERIHKKIVG